MLNNTSAAASKWINAHIAECTALDEAALTALRFADWSELCASMARNDWAPNLSTPLDANETQARAFEALRTAFIVRAMKFR